MKLPALILLLMVIVPKEFLNSQGNTMSESIKNISEKTTTDFKELFYAEPGAKKRVYFSCEDSLLSSNCKIIRNLYFNAKGNIVSDTTFRDTLYSSTNRIYSKIKIAITKTQPVPSLFKYRYETTIDSLILDSLQRPIRFYEQGIYSKKWNYDSLGRICEFIENPDNEFFHKKRTYNYLSDSIIITSSSRTIYQFDTIYNYLIFDSLKRLIFDKSKKKSIEYKNKGYEVYFDSIQKFEFFPNYMEEEYRYISDSLLMIYDNQFLYTQEIKLNHNQEIVETKVFDKDSKLLGKSEYYRLKDKIIKKRFQDGILIETTETDLFPNGTIKCESRVSNFHHSRENECHNEEGLIVQKTRIEDGKIVENLKCIAIDK